ncbi:unnamed protein product [Danaus chrysippus]|uniref:(African queen) hypothetical protein n=1 Tax=Danaus chrysippus TaxID=151541 RepID=A0A8J2W5U2_9NEOP|nr:unnamed protein product [Danaus chrysippus]
MFVLGQTRRRSAAGAGGGAGGGRSGIFNSIPVTDQGGVWRHAIHLTQETRTTITQGNFEITQLIGWDEKRRLLSSAPGSQLVTEQWAPRWGWYLAAARNFIVAEIDARGSGGQVYPDEGHSFERSFLHVYSSMEQFFDECFGPVELADWDNPGGLFPFRD